MALEYDSFAAIHYKAYRPPLHEIILKKYFTAKTKHELGLDIGCGTGHSSIALTKLCNQVIGIDTSKFMLEYTAPHKNINYQYFDGRNLKFDADSFSIITLAGSLFYAKSQGFLDELIRVSKNNSQIIIYDFDVNLKSILSHFKFKVCNRQVYDHQIDFSGLNDNNIILQTNDADNITLEISSKNVAHLLLSVKAQRLFFEKLYLEQNVHSQLTENLKELSNKDNFMVNVSIFCKVYKVFK
ncbi:methyltransferase domain-containing protein [Kriegella sp. EG-1]|nr:methyltransferase domain-containing protein [Flavobacteriaceae bacterium EG-1]